MVEQINQTNQVQVSGEKPKWLIWILIAVGIIVVVAIGFVIYLLVSGGEEMGDVGGEVSAPEETIPVEEIAPEIETPAEEIVPMETTPEIIPEEEVVALEEIFPGGLPPVDE